MCTRLHDCLDAHQSMDHTGFRPGTGLEDAFFVFESLCRKGLEWNAPLTHVVGYCPLFPHHNTSTVLFTSCQKRSCVGDIFRLQTTPTHTPFAAAHMSLPHFQRTGVRTKFIKVFCLHETTFENNATIFLCFVDSRHMAGGTVGATFPLHLNTVPCMFASRGVIGYLHHCSSKVSICLHFVCCFLHK